MAKRRRLKTRSTTTTSDGSTGSVNSNQRSDAESQPTHSSADVRHAVLNPLSIAAAMFSGAIVYLAYFPNDSVSVERGDALWFTFLTMIIGAVCVAFGTRVGAWSRGSVAELVLRFGPWCLAVWMMLAAWGTSSGASPTGNLRSATNEGWFWFAAAAMFVSARVLSESLAFRRAVTTLMMVSAFGLAVYGLHQYFVSLPEMRLQYQENPERVLELAGWDAPEGSSERMVFENRLLDGGPTGTFALANSLAAILLVGVVAGVGVIRRRMGPWTVVQWVAASLVVVVCLGSLLSTRSRSATLAMLVGIGLVLAVSSIRGRNKRGLWIAIGAVACLGVVIIAALATIGNREWFEEAPASLAFRFQYWRSTWQLVIDHPWFGAGPGNFKALYEQYREASAHEQIAEPHNLFVETLASGGFVGLGLLITVMVAAVFRVASYSISSPSEAAQTPVNPDEQDANEGEVVDDRDRWAWLGVAISFVLVWLLGMASRQLPDFEASFWAVPSSLALGFVLWGIIKRMPGQAIDQIWCVAVVALGIHLMAAGGWTVPGVAIVLWLGGGILTRQSPAVTEFATESVIVGAAESVAASVPSSRASRFRFQAIALIVGLILVSILYTLSIRPVNERQRLMMAASTARQPQQRRMILEQAVQADPWSTDAVLWLTDWYRSVLIQRDDARLRRQWNEWLQEAKRRGGADPAIYRQVGIQELHLFQRHGDAIDLENAAASFEKAVAWSPSNQWMMAQLAHIEAVTDDFKSARALAERASELSVLGGNIERALSRQQIYLARELGSTVQSGPVRVPADEVLAPILTEAVENDSRR